MDLEKKMYIKFEGENTEKVILTAFGVTWRKKTVVDMISLLYHCLYQT